MATYKTPGVYVEEISVLPPSVAQVETAIPAFIGYTAKAEKNGQDLTNRPTRISNMLEYNEYFGGQRTFSAGAYSLQLDKSKNYKVIEDSFAIQKLLNMYNSLRQFYDNGGGPCYIVSVGSYEDTVEAGDETDPAGAGLRVGVKALEKVDEPTMIVLPDAANLDDAAFYSLQQMAIAQCGVLQDRVAVLDLREYQSNTDKYVKANSYSDVYAEFRNRIGINDLKYAAAYTPFLETSYFPAIPYTLFKANVKDGANAAIDFTVVTADAALNGMVAKLENAHADLEKLQTSLNSLLSGSPTLSDKYRELRNAMVDPANTNAGAKTALTQVAEFFRSAINAVTTWDGSSQFQNIQLQNDLKALAKDSSVGFARFIGDYVAFEKQAQIDPIISPAFPTANLNAANIISWFTGLPDSVFPPPKTDVGTIVANTNTYAGANNREIVAAAVNDVDGLFALLDNFIRKVRTASEKYVSSNEAIVYASHPIISAAVSHLQKQLAVVPPSGAVAGAYANVDRTRGVWKAPANVSLNNVTGPRVLIDNATQDGLNVDADSGKSINAIRAFAGKGTLIWGARTLDGNSNEWRYISVRRLFNMVEESVKKSTYPFVFEPNDMNTWVKVKGMIENYLTNIWRQGALAGAKPEHAFFVNIGLGITMTAVDVLEGRMNVEIGMAAVRPAEFIILKFSHKMQES